MCAEKKMDKEVLSNGISYYLSPLLNWTLAGVVRALLSEIQHQKCVRTMEHYVLPRSLTSTADTYLPSIIKLRSCKR